MKMKRHEDESSILTTFRSDVEDLLNHFLQLPKTPSTMALDSDNSHGRMTPSYILCTFCYGWTSKSPPKMTEMVVLARTKRSIRE